MAADQSDSDVSKSQFVVLAGDPLLAQLVLLDLAGPGEGKILDREPLAWRLVRSEMLSEVAEQQTLVDLVPGCRPDKRADGLAPADEG